MNNICLRAQIKQQKCRENVENTILSLLFCALNQNQCNNFCQYSGMLQPDAKRARTVKGRRLKLPCRTRKGMTVAGDAGYQKRGYDSLTSI